MSSTEEIRKAITEALEEIRKHVASKAIAQVELDKHDALLKKANERYLSLCVDLYAASVDEAEGKPVLTPSPQDQKPLAATMTNEQIISYALDKRAHGWTWEEIARSIRISRRALSGIIGAANVDPALLIRKSRAVSAH